jgi:hypothetical protein
MTIDLTWSADASDVVVLETLTREAPRTLVNLVGPRHANNDMARAALALREVVTGRASLVGKIVRYVVGGAVVFFGTCEYMSDGWVGIRQWDGRLDEAPVALVSEEPQDF